MVRNQIRFQVRNIKPLFEEFLEKAPVTSKSMYWKTAWGTSEFGLFDLSGNRITFYEDL